MKSLLYFFCAFLDVDLLSDARVTLLRPLERVRKGKCKFTCLESSNLPHIKDSDSMDKWIATTYTTHGNVIIVSPEGRCSKNSAAQSFLPAVLLVISAVLLHCPNLFPSGLEEEMAAADVQIGSAKEICRQNRFMSRVGGEELLLGGGSFNCCARGGTDAGVKRSLLL